MVDYNQLNRVQEGIKGTSYVIRTIGMYGSPFDAITQYIANGIDAGARRIHVDVLPEDHIVIVEDNGLGMTREKLASLPSSIGASDKTYAVRKSNEHPKIGLHAFGEYAYQTLVPPRTGELVVISRPQGHESYNILVRRHEGPREGVIRAQDVEYGAFSHGTRVIIKNVYDDTMRILKGFSGERSITRNLSDTLDVCLRKGHVKIFVNDRAGKESVPPLEYKGDVLLEKNVPVDYTDELGQIRKGEVQFYIVGSPEGSGRIRLCLQDAKVLSSLASLPQLDNDPFNSLVLGGYVNSVDLLWPTSEKHGIQTDQNRFLPFKTVIDAEGDVLREHVKRLMESRDVSLDRRANELLQELYKTSIGLRLEGAHSRGGTKKGKGGEKPPSHRDVRTPFTARLVEFPASEADRLSKVEGQVIYINKSSPDYQRSVGEGRKSEERFILGLLANGYASWTLTNVMKHTAVNPEMIDASRETAYKMYVRTLKKASL